MGDLTSISYVSTCRFDRASYSLVARLESLQEDLGGLARALGFTPAEERMVEQAVAKLLAEHAAKRARRG